VNEATGAITINFPDREPWELEETCALDVAERGGETLERIGELINLTRERVRQLEVIGSDVLKRALATES
jgi:DNA-directed RNA polymerase sigma subunit (sigma70/sigma32)